jgi:hypothetical protein
MVKKGMMQNAHWKKKTQKFPAQKGRTQHRTGLSKQDCEGIPEFMIRLARERGLQIFEGIAMPKYRHD